MEKAAGVEEGGRRAAGLEAKSLEENLFEI